MGDWRHRLMFAVCALAATALALAPPIPQDPAYHGFADQRTLFGIPNFWNVATNLPFLAVAAVGGIRLPRFAHPVPGHAYALLCAGVLLVTFGSSYYHWAPHNATLAWDRLPMTLAFMSLMSLLISERISPRTGQLLLWPLLVAGAGSVAWWRWTETMGAGDLRPYALVQFLPLLLIPLMLWLFPQRFICAHRLWVALGLYALAKLAEHFDRAVFDATGWMGGHGIKHLLAALAIWFVVQAVSPAPRTA